MYRLIFLFNFLTVWTLNLKKMKLDYFKEKWKFCQNASCLFLLFRYCFKNQTVLKRNSWNFAKLPTFSCLSQSIRSFKTLLNNPEAANKQPRKFVYSGEVLAKDVRIFTWDAKSWHEILTTCKKFCPFSRSQLYRNLKSKIIFDINYVC